MPPKAVEEPQEPQAQPKSSKKLILIIAAAVILLGGGGAGAYFKFFKRPKRLRAPRSRNML